MGQLFLLLKKKLQNFSLDIWRRKFDLKLVSLIREYSLAIYWNFINTIFLKNIMDFTHLSGGLKRIKWRGWQVSELPPPDFFTNYELNLNGLKPTYFKMDEIRSAHWGDQTLAGFTFSQRWVWRVPTSGMICRAALVKCDVPPKHRLLQEPHSETSQKTAFHQIPGLQTDPC